MQLKLDELIRATEAADNAIIRAEDETDDELARLKQQYEALCDEHAALQARFAQTTGDGLADPSAAAPAVPARVTRIEGTWRRRDLTPLHKGRIADSGSAFP